MISAEKEKEKADFDLKKKNAKAAKEANRIMRVEIANKKKNDVKKGHKVIQTKPSETRKKNKVRAKSSKASHNWIDEAIPLPVKKASSRRVDSLKLYFEDIKGPDSEALHCTDVDMNEIICTIHASERIKERFGTEEARKLLLRSLRATENRQVFKSRRSTIRLLMPDGAMMDYIFSVDLQHYIAYSPVENRAEKSSLLRGTKRDWSVDDLSIVEQVVESTLNDEGEKKTEECLHYFLSNIREQLQENNENNCLRGDGNGAWVDDEVVKVMVVLKGEDNIITEFVLDRTMKILITVYPVNSKVSFSKWKEIRHENNGYVPRKNFSPLIVPKPLLSRIVSQAIPPTTTYLCAGGARGRPCNKPFKKLTSCQKCGATFCSTSCAAKHKTSGCLK